MPTNFDSISVILNNIRSIRNSHGEAQSSISCQDHVYAWMKQQSSWCNLSQNENVNKARLTYCTAVLLLYCASRNGDRSLKYLTNLICFYIFKAIFWSCFSMGRILGSWDPWDPPWLRAWLLDLQDRSLLPVRTACLLTRYQQPPQQTDWHSGVGSRPVRYDLLADK